MTQTTARPLYEIAEEVKADWRHVNYAAEPYLEALTTLDKITDRFYEDTAESIVRYFLSNATTWRGETAQRVKAELKALLPKR